MEDDLLSEWAALGLRLARAEPEKFDEVLRSIRNVVEAQELLAGFDWQLFLRGRPRKRYLA